MPCPVNTKAAFTVLNAEIVGLPNCPEFRVLYSGPHEAYCRAAAERAVMHHGRPWVLKMDAEMKALTLQVWQTEAPGWCAKVEAHHAHSGLAHHVRMIGGVLVSAETAEAVVAIRALKDPAGFARKPVECFLGHGASLTTVPMARALLEPGTQSYTTEQRLDTDAYDQDDTTVRLRTVVGRAKVPFSAFALNLLRAPSGQRA